MKNVAIIMAGGSGTRLWPLSRKSTPKQFLKLTNKEKTMIQLTRDRISSLIDTNDIFVVTTELYKDIVYKQLPDISKDNIIVQPLNRNTAPCIALVSEIIKDKYKDANVVVLASDHNIKNNKLLIDCIQTGINNLNDNNIVTIGIVPNRIETGYGYIKLGKKNGNENVYEVDKFVEKPNFEKAKEYYESCDYLWNSGMFIWKNSYILKCVEKFVPKIYNGIKEIMKSKNTANYGQILFKEYEKMESISIDYAVMEKVKNILVIPGNFGWDDVGSWLALERLTNLDKNNNILKGKIVALDSNDNIVINETNEKLIATLGVNNSVIVQTETSTLIINKEQVPEISKLLKEIEDNNLKEYL